MAPSQAAVQAALYHNRRRRLSRVILASLTPWQVGLVVTVGEYVSGDGGTTPYIAATAGTTAGTDPTTDTGVTWVRQDVQSLLQFLNTGAPTP